MILIVEDDISLGRIYAKILENEGYVVNWFAKGQEALSFLNSETPDLMIIDLSLPDMNGVQVARIAREMGYLNPMIAISGAVDLENLQTPDFNAKVPKPIGLNELLEVVHQNYSIALE